VSDIKVFPSNNATTYDGDIAIVKLATAIPANITIAYAVLPASGSDPAADLTTSTVGWGKLLENATTLPTELFKVDIPVVDREDCATALAQINDVTETMFCAGLIDGGKDTCQGDSGGPITDCATKVLLGTVSWGRGCARPELPGVYSNIGEESLNNWIVENL
jgi:trypsin